MDREISLAAVILPAILLGIPAGILWTVSPGGTAILLAAAAAAAGLAALAPTQQRRFVLLLFLAGLTLRITLSLGLDLAAWVIEGGPPVQEGSFDRTRRFVKAPDSDDYSERADAVAQIAHGNRDPNLRFALSNPHGKPAHLYGIAVFYYLFGFSPFAVKWIQGLLGALMGPLLFLIGIRCVHPAAARMAAVGVAFFPSLVLWSATNLKEASFGFLALAAVLLLLRTLDSAGRRRLLCAVSAAALLHLCALLREPLFPILLGASALTTLAVLMTLRHRREALLAVTLGLAILAGLLFQRVLPHALAVHMGYVAGLTGETYRILPEEYYTPAAKEAMKSGELKASWGEMAAWTIRSVLHYWGEPFPSRIHKGIHLAVYPQMVFWYLLTPLCLWGIWVSLRCNPAALLPALLLLSWTCLGALSNGNVGTVFRLRDMVTPWALLFASAGFWALLIRPARGGTR